MKIEELIFSNLLHNEEFTRKTIPFLKEEYFHDFIDLKIFSIIQNYVQKYNASPSKEALLIDLNNATGLSDEQYESAVTYIKSFTKNETQELDWIVDQTEKFCQDKAIYNAIMNSIKILDDKEANISRGSIPELLSNALGVSFESSIGHDFLEDADERYDFYHEEHTKIPFDLELLNKITGGGLRKKTLNLVMAETGGGKSIFLCHNAAAHLAMGYNVLYITMEMAEKLIAQRIDANLFDLPLNLLETLDKASYTKTINKLKSKTTGRLIIKEYPSGAASSANFRHLINELRIKKNFIPDVIYIDYLNICTSARVKNNQANSYTIVKSIAEEIRGLATEFDVPIVSATQVNRGGMSNSDLDMTNTSESIGIAHTLDLFLALIPSEDLDALNQIMFKQLKNRYNDVNYYRKFVLGLDKSKMKFYDLENSAQDNISESGTKDDGDRKQKFGGLK